MKVKLEDSWLERLEAEFNKSYMSDLKKFLIKEKEKGKTIYPKGGNIFAALNLTPFNSVRAVILGQDPYHGPNQAHGLSFSVPGGVEIPPSLLNIFKEIENDLDIKQKSTGDLKPWADQGVLLLNSVLTVEKSQAGSHSGKGWEKFTDKIISTINEERDGVVFFLWGAYAQNKAHMIDSTKHLLLKSPHPSPLSAHRGFFGKNHFSKCNRYLESKNNDPIIWKL